MDIAFKIQEKTFYIRDILLFAIVYFCVTMFAITALHFPGFINYLGDILMLIFIIALIKAKKIVSDKYLLYTNFAFFLLTLVAYVLNQYSLILYIWGFRKVILPFFFLLSCVAFWNIEYLNKVTIIFEKLFHINFALVLTQFALGYRQDFLNGMYGIKRGGNGCEALYLCLMISMEITFYLYKKRNVKQLVYFVGASLLISAMAELKAVFVVVVIVGIIAILSKPIVKTIGIVIGTIILLVITIRIMYVINPYFRDFFSLERLIDYVSNESGYTGVGDFNRIGGLTVIYQYYLKSPFQKMFGLGLGYTEYSGWRILTSQFYRTYQSTTHYSWFSDLMFLLENGVLGSIMFLLSYVIIAIRAFCGFIHKIPNREYLIIGIQTVAIALFFLVYTNILRDYQGVFLLYGFMAMPLIAIKEARSKNH